MNLEQNNHKPGLISTLVAVIVIGGIFIVVVGLALKAIFFQTPEPEIRKIVETVVEEREVLLRAPKCERTFGEYQKLVNDSRSVTLTEDQTAYATNGILQGEKTIVLERSGEGEIACGYLYVRALRTNGEFQEKYDSIYINPHDFGGHLLRPRSITFEKESEEKAEILLPLREVAYLPNVPYDPEAQNFKVADWVKLLNVSNETSFIMGLSVANGVGIIEEVSIAYRCWDPKTGKETTSCQLGKKK